uniref:(northern house mosquito) hypothetical protein n=1 Tax=Culex pipiens TaxID=7175 RepID=A0A8D8NK95_CULPI
MAVGEVKILPLQLLACSIDSPNFHGFHVSRSGHTFEIYRKFQKTFTVFSRLRAFFSTSNRGRVVAFKVCVCAEQNQIREHTTNSARHTPCLVEERKPREKQLWTRGRRWLFRFGPLDG